MPIFIAKLKTGIWIMFPALNTVSLKPSDARPVECASHIALQLRLGLPSGQEENSEYVMNLFDNENLKWRRFVGDDSFDYPIDYEASLLSIRDDGHVDLLYRWAPNSYCHFHRHTAETTSTVLKGELHVETIDPDTGETLDTKVRKAGDYAHKEPGDVHMERGGPEGALVLFNLQAIDNSLAESLAQDGTVISESRFDDMLARRRAKRG